MSNVKFMSDLALPVERPALRGSGIEVVLNDLSVESGTERMPSMGCQSSRTRLATRLRESRRIILRSLESMLQHTNDSHPAAGSAGQLD